MIYTIDEIKRLLKPFNLSEVCRQTGISRMTMHNISKGKDVSYSVIEKLSKFILDYKTS